ncbi:S26 family signal peptidase [Psittacicella hinzii]|uniref:Peptidase S26 domain-containing protein n=1 Tax=Psittacicella hinzii TaxID=2028575 RepID=A0A3A1YLV6_9GAMM|nr:S26 family signal peptidase [Psittacicella hinzii]RIY38645.1 hypothetical protein CKF58_03705 [Psittacicella hinzii]
MAKRKWQNLVLTANANLTQLSLKKRKFYLRMGVCMLVAFACYLWLPKCITFYLDNQKTTSIMHSRYYFGSKLLSPAEAGPISVYRVAYRQLPSHAQAKIRQASKEWVDHPQQLELIANLLRQSVNTYPYQTWDQGLRGYKYGFKHTNLTLDPVPLTQAKDDPLYPYGQELPILTMPQGKLKSHLRSTLHTFSNRLLPYQQLRGNVDDSDGNSNAGKKINTQARVLIPSLPPETKFVKYLIGYPHDLVDLTPEGLFINGIFIKELPAAIVEVITKLPQQIRRIYLQPEQYWAYGDDPTSIDSVYFGPVPKTALEAKVIWAK